MKKKVKEMVVLNPDVFFQQCQFDPTFRHGTAEKELTRQINSHKYVSGDRTIGWRVRSRLQKVRSTVLL